MRGAGAGRDEGRRAGESAGYRAAATAAENEKYQAKLDEIYAADGHHTVAIYSVGILVGSVLLGFAAQYLILFVPRYFGLLYDIDRLVLPAHATEVDLTRISPSSRGPPDLGKPGPLLPLLFLMFLMSMGCETQERRAWKEGYNENYRAAYQEGWQAGEVKGRADGEEWGTAAAEKAARAGSDWRFYSTEAVCGFVFGFVGGLLVQYSLLIGCGQSGRLPQFLTVAFVPCMKRSLAYAVFERRRALMMDLAETLRQVRAKNKVELAKIQAVRDNVARRLKAIGSIEELNAAHLVELARKEISQIIGASEEEANRPEATTRPEPISQQPPEPRFTYYCPICWTAVRYDEELVHKTVPCPNDDCRRPLTLPPPLRTAEAAKAINFAHGD